MDEVSTLSQLNPLSSSYDCHLLPLSLKEKLIACQSLYDLIHSLNRFVTPSLWVVFRPLYKISVDSIGDLPTLGSLSHFLDILSLRFCLLTAVFFLGNCSARNTWGQGRERKHNLDQRKVQIRHEEGNQATIEVERHIPTEYEQSSHCGTAQIGWSSQTDRNSKWPQRLIYCRIFYLPACIHTCWDLIPLKCALLNAYWLDLSTL